jgi:hypothetical protein
MRAVAWVLGGSLAAGGCGDAAGCVDLGDEVMLTAQVTDNGERVRVEVELRHGDLGAESIPLKLCKDEALRVDEVAMTQVKRPSGAVIYEATLAAVSGQEPASRRFELDHGGDVSEFTAVIDAPGFEITAPSGDSEVSRGAPLTIHWTPARGSDATMIVKLADEIDGDVCLGQPLELEEPDDGEVVVAGAEVELTTKMAPADGVCEAVLTLSRAHDSALKQTGGGAALHPDSRVQATTSRTVAFASVP